MTTGSHNDVFFSASLLFGSLRNGKFTAENLWEESIILVQAGDEQEARRKALEIGQTRSLSYKANDGAHISWEFFRIERLFRIKEDKLVHGTELFSRHLRADEVESLGRPFSD
jgi:hypothetical protein